MVPLDAWVPIYSAAAIGGSSLGSDLWRSHGRATVVRGVAHSSCASFPFGLSDSVSQTCLPYTWVDFLAMITSLVGGFFSHYYCFSASGISSEPCLGAVGLCFYYYTRLSFNSGCFWLFLWGSEPLVYVVLP